MKSAKIIAPFSVSALLFVLSYLSSRESNSGSFPLILLFIGIFLAIVGVAAIFSNNK